MSFQDFNLPESLLSALQRASYIKPSRIQEIAIPPGLRGEHVIVQAGSGSGKTVAFAITCLAKLDASFTHAPEWNLPAIKLIPEVKSTVCQRLQSLVLCPTREIAVQCADEITRVGWYRIQKEDISIVCATGGVPINADLLALRIRQPQILVATTGRLLSLIQDESAQSQSKVIKRKVSRAELERLRYKLPPLRIIVFEEADRLLSENFRDQTLKLVAVISSTPMPEAPQCLFYSATYPVQLLNVSQKIVYSILNAYLRQKQKQHKQRRVKTAPNEAVRLESEAIVGPQTGGPINEEQSAQPVTPADGSSRDKVNDHAMEAFKSTTHGAEPLTTEDTTAMDISEDDTNEGLTKVEEKLEDHSSVPECHRAGKEDDASRIDKDPVPSLEDTTTAELPQEGPSESTSILPTTGGDGDRTEDCGAQAEDESLLKVEDSQAMEDILEDAAEVKDSMKIERDRKRRKPEIDDELHVVIDGVSPEPPSEPPWRILRKCFLVSSYIEHKQDEFREGATIPKAQLPRTNMDEAVPFLELDTPVLERVKCQYILIPEETDIATLCTVLREGLELDKYSQCLTTEVPTPQGCLEDAAQIAVKIVKEGDEELLSNAVVDDQEAVEPSAETSQREGGEYCGGIVEESRNAVSSPAETESMSVEVMSDHKGPHQSSDIKQDDETSKATPETSSEARPAREAASPENCATNNKTSSSETAAECTSEEAINKLIELANYLEKDEDWKHWADLLPKFLAILGVMWSTNNSFQACCLFCNDAFSGQKVATTLCDLNVPSAFLSSRMNQAVRLRHLQALKNGKLRVLVCSDVLARGIDVPEVDLVLNIDLPHEKETLLHRIGRAGRFGRHGRCIFIMRDEDEMFTLKLFAMQTGFPLDPLIAPTITKPPQPSELATAEGII